MPTASEVPALEIRQVAKRYQVNEGATLLEFLPALFRGKGWRPAFYALKNINFTVAHGETLGVVGRNGSGKSTLLKLIAGVTAPSEGEVIVRGRVSPLIELGAGFHPDLTGRENIFLNASILGLTNVEIRERFDDIVNFAEVWSFIDTPVKHYSSGMYLRLGFAVAAYSNPAVLLVDEGIAVGDTAFQEKCVAKMEEFQRAGVTIILATHSFKLATDFCQRLILLDSGIAVLDGEPGPVMQKYASIMGLVPEQVEGPL